MDPGLQIKALDSIVLPDRLERRRERFHFEILSRTFDRIFGEAVSRHWSPRPTWIGVPPVHSRITHYIRRSVSRFTLAIKDRCCHSPVPAVLFFYRLSGILLMCVAGLSSSPSILGHPRTCCTARRISSLLAPCGWRKKKAVVTS